MLTKRKGNFMYKSSIIVTISNEYALTENFFDNLLLNSVQQNEKKRERLWVKIEVSVRDDFLYFVYKDNGVGLSDKYKEEPMKILEPHET